MKRLFLFVWLFAAALAFGEDSAPTLDLVAGWSWWPYCYDRYPYGYAPCWRGYPAVGVGLPMNRWDPDYPYGYCGCGPFWGYGYAVRIDLIDKRHLPALSEGLLQPFPGSAPTELRDPRREQLWSRDIESLLVTPKPAALQAPATNPPPQTATP